VPGAPGGGGPAGERTAASAWGGYRSMKRVLSYYISQNSFGILAKSEFFPKMICPHNRPFQKWPKLPKMAEIKFVKKK
jgi:hypothetical protein